MATDWEFYALIVLFFVLLVGTAWMLRRVDWSAAWRRLRGRDAADHDANSRAFLEEWAVDEERRAYQAASRDLRRGRRSAVARRAEKQIELMVKNLEEADGSVVDHLIEQHLALEKTQRVIANNAKTRIRAQIRKGEELDQALAEDEAEVVLVAEYVRGLLDTFATTKLFPPLAGTSFVGLGNSGENKLKEFKRA